MRRSDREVTDPESIDEFLRTCDCCRVAFSTEGAPYIVPLTPGFAAENGRRVFYFHCAKAGRKLELLARNPAVGFELDGGHLLHAGENACEYALGFQSVIGTGVLSVVTDEAERRFGLERVMARASGRDDWTFSPAMLASVAVLRLDVSELACKKHP